MTCRPVSASSCSGQERSTGAIAERPAVRPTLVQVIQVWDCVIHYAECTHEELWAIVPILLELLDGSTDLMYASNPLLRRCSVAAIAVRANATFRSASPEKRDRTELTEYNLHIMECKRAVCNLLLVVLDLLVDEVPWPSLMTLLPAPSPP